MTPPETHGWKRVDKAAFGIIYGAVMVLSILMAAGGHPEAEVKRGVVLFGSVLAITLAKAFVELLAPALDSDERITRHALRGAWHHGSPSPRIISGPSDA